MKSHFPFTLTMSALVMLCPWSSQASVAPKTDPLPNFDKRALPPAGGAAVTAEQAAAAEQLRARLPQVQISFDRLIGAPKMVAASDGFLTGPNGLGKAVVAAAGVAPDAPDRATRLFLDAQRSLFGHGAEALNQARMIRDYVTPHNGLKTVVWEQQAAGIAVFEGRLISHTTRQGELVNVCSQFLPDPASASRMGDPAAPSLSAVAALVLAARNLGLELAEAKISARGEPAADAELRQRFTAPGLKGEAEVKLIWLPLDKQALQLCWDVILMSRSRGEMFRVLVEASGGEILLRRCLTSYLTEASYRVYTSDSPSPFSPGTPTPVNTQPPLTSRALVTLSALDTNASPAGWINDGDNQTLGNNVDAHSDWNADNIADLPRPQGAPFRVFDFPMDLTTQDPTNYTSAAVVQLFYWANWYHDRLHQLGFTEGAGNFQTSNFGRGGLGSDAVQADAQDGSGTDNANFSTPPDGSAGRMQMYIFTGPSPRRDGDFDAEVVLHELTHGLSWRLVGGGQGLGDTQSDGMGEGWSDFYGLSLLSEAGDDVNGIYAAGAYASYKIGGAGDTLNYYFGIRRYPYSTDLGKNPLTFKDIDPAQADYCSSSAPYHTGMFGACSASSAAAVHNEGEVWCVALWEARANLVNRYGWVVGNQLMLQLVTDGMKLTPMHPNFLQARDAILQADLVDNGGANRMELWAAFAKRGMGFSATSPDSSTSVGVVESFDLPDDLRIAPMAPSIVTGPVGGPFAPSSLGFTLTNAGGAALSWNVANPNAWLEVQPGGGTLTPGGPALTVTASLTALANSLPMGIYPATIWFTNLNSLVGLGRQISLRVGQPDNYTAILDSRITNLAFQAFTFTPDGSSSFYSICRQPVTAFFTDPAGGTSLTLGDDSYSTATVAGGNSVAIYGTRSSTFYVGSNGYLTMNSGANSMVETYSTHFSLPRVAALFHDLNPGVGGTVSWKQLADRAAVTYQAVPVYGASAQTNSFQIEMFFDGRIRLTYLDIKAPRALVGLSAGVGQPANFLASDFTTYGSCSPLLVVLPVSAGEGAGVLASAGSVWVSSVLPTNLDVSLSSSVPSRLVVSPTATIPAGQLYATFDLTLMNNNVNDGNQTVAVTASAMGFTNVSGSVLVIDDDTPPQVVSQPTNWVGMLGASAGFSVGASGGAPLAYAWRRNGKPLAGATNSSYTTNNVQLADSGSLFSCLLSNAFGTTSSSEVVLTVLTGPPEAYTEWFSGSPHVNDLAYQSFTFIPDGSVNFYTICRQGAVSFPTDPAGGTTVSLTDDSYAQANLTGTNTVAIYNSRTNVLFIGSNGYLTLNSGDTAYSSSFTNHFNRPRVSAWFRDLYPPGGGSVSWKQLSNRVAVTYQNVLEFGSSTSNSFQMELFFDGRIRITYLGMAALYGLAGLSAGQGLPPLFTESDFTAYSACIFPPPFIVTQTTSSALAFRWAAIVGQSYQLEYKTNLTQAGWLSLGPPITATSGAASTSDSTTNGQRFYRIRLVP
jgi:hypothetical protein